MKRRKLGMASIGLLLVGAAVLAQQGSSSAKLLLSFQRVNTYMEQGSSFEGPNSRSDDTMHRGMVQHYPTTSMCLLVYGDGSYYFEKMDERTQGKPKIKASNGSLAPAELEQLKSVTSEKGFRDISSPEPPEPPNDATYLKEGEVITTKVVRPEGAQEFTLTRRRYATTGMSSIDKVASNWQGLDKTLKPFLSWVKDMEKKGQSGAKDAASTGCPAVAGG